jgi:pyridoxal phosphate enzyme (YggS family)
MISPTLGTRYADISRRVSQLNPKATLIAVSKTQPVEAIEALYRLGHRDFGENYVQELVAKARELDLKGFRGIRWHFIGHLQTNKVKMLLPHVYAVHSVDSEKLIYELGKRVEITSPALPVFVEVNVSKQESKSGVPPERVSDLVDLIRTQTMLKLEGLMAIPDPDRADLTAPFKQLKALRDELRAGPSLSMGMTSDFEAALKEGATHVRVGTAIFGARN